MLDILIHIAAKKKAPNKLAALSTNFIEKEHLEATKTEKQREKDRKQAAAAEARKNYKNTLLYPEDEFVAGRVHNNVGGSNPVIGLGGVTNRSFISGLLSRAAGAMDGRGGRRRDYIEPPEVSIVWVGGCSVLFCTVLFCSVHCDGMYTL